MSHVFLERGCTEVVVRVAGNGIADGSGETLHGLVHESIGLAGRVYGGVDGGGVGGHEAGGVGPGQIGAFLGW